MKYTVCSFEDLHRLCIDNDWFNAGTNQQYYKLFYANEHGYSIEEIATIIWLCTDCEESGCCRRDILEKLLEKLKISTEETEEAK